ncbi:MAG: RnfABCDGE type electron transport complex subunit D [Clostridium sp.]|nr:RnfABCDGE type electron transport complex subunit D [Clostridium sp.]
MSHIRAGRLRQPPQLAQSGGVAAVMLDVMVALLPPLAMAVFFFGYRALVLTAISVLTCVLAERYTQRLLRRPDTTHDLSACVTGLMLAMCMPATAPYWAPVLGGLFAIVVVKQFYGGLGKNFMNPALAGRMMLTTFPYLMTHWTDALHHVPLLETTDAVAAATPMAYLHEGVLPPHRLSQLLAGQQAGSLGEVSAFMLLLGGGYLVLRKVISLRIPVSFLGTVAVLSLCTAPDVPPVRWMMVQLLSGGLLFGAIFMATDYTTTPITPRGQVLFGVGCGALTVLLRLYGSYPEGVGWAILTMNCCVWLLDRAGMPRRFGVKNFVVSRRGLEKLRQSLARIRFVRPRLHLVKADGSVPGEAHLDQVRTWGKALAVLAALVLLVGLGLSRLSAFTELDTARAELDAQQELLSQVMPQASIRSEVPYSSPYALSITAGYSREELVGYCVEVQSYGFGGVMTLVVGVDLNGQVTGVAVTDHNETGAIGSQAISEDYLEQYIGRSGTIRHSGTNAVDAVAGATDTCQAITVGVNRALAIVAKLGMEGEVDYVDGEV